MAEVNYAELYEQALQQKYTDELKFVALYSSPNNGNVRWSGAKTVHIPSITTGGFTDVDRDVVSGYTRRADNDWETKTIEHDREFTTLVDPMDIDESNMALSIANITNVFNSEHKIPEMDKYASSKLFAEYEAFGGVVDETVVDATNALTVFDQFMEDLDEAEQPQDGRILYVTPKVYTVLKNAEQIQRTLDVRGGSAGVNRQVHSLDDVNIVRVPSSRMQTAYDFTDGAVVDDGSQAINMIMIHPGAVITPQKYDFVSLDEPSAKTGGKYLYYERKYWDLFVIENKVAGIKFNVVAGE